MEFCLYVLNGSTQKQLLKYQCHARVGDFAYSRSAVLTVIPRSNNLVLVISRFVSLSACCLSTVQHRIVSLSGHYCYSGSWMVMATDLISYCLYQTIATIVMGTATHTIFL